VHPAVVATALTDCFLINLAHYDIVLCYCAPGFIHCSEVHKA